MKIDQFFSDFFRKLDNSYEAEPDYRHGTEPAIGVLLANLGTPDAPEPGALRRYLAQFLNDRRVIEIPRAIWWPILYGPILTFRPRKVAKLYGSIWTEQGSPLLSIGLQQRDELQRRFSEEVGAKVHFALGMRYGNPSIRSALRELREANCTRILFLPLYPQYAAPTTASTLDALAREMLRWRRIPELRTINGYHEHAGYIDALASSIRETWIQPSGQEDRPERIVFSYHGVPQRYLEEGDPYHCYCHQTTRLVVERLGIPAELAVTTFQSQFGPERWIRPATDETIEALAKAGVRKLDIISPAFSADCLETLEELEGENREIFEEHGGERFRYIPCLNVRTDHMDALEHLIRRHMNGWLENAEAWKERMETLRHSGQRVRSVEAQATSDFHANTFSQAHTASQPEPPSSTREQSPAP